MRLFTLKTFLPCVLSVAIAACSSNEDAAKTYFAEGLSWYEQGDMQKARVEFLNAMQKNPQMADAYYYLGLIAKTEGDMPLVFENMSIAMRLDENNRDAILQVAEIQVYAKQFDEALETIRPLIEKHPEFYDAQRVKAAALLGQKKLDDAKTLLETLAAKNPGDAAVYSLQSVIQREEGDTKAALESLDKAIRYADEKKQYRLIRLALNRELNNLPAIQKELTALINENPDDVQYRYALAKLYMEQGQPRAAEKSLNQLIEKSPDNITAKKFLVEAVLAYDKAKGNKVLDDFIRAYPNAFELQFYKINLLLKARKTGAAQKELQRLIDMPQVSDVVKSNARAMQAEIYLRQSKKEEALQLLQKNLTSNAQHEPTLLLLATNDLNEKHYDSAVSKLNTILRRNPESEQGLLLLGQVYMAKGSPLLADDSFRQVLNLDPANKDAAIPVVKKLLADNDLERSEKIMARVLAKHPGDMRIQSMLVNVLIEKRAWKKAEAAIATIRKNPDFNAYADFLSARLLQARGKLAESLDAFKQVLASNPQMLPALQGLAANYVALGQQAELLAYLDEYNQQNPTLVHGYVLAARLYKTDNQPDNAIAALQTALEKSPAWEEGYSMLADYLMSIGREAEGIEVYKKGIDTLKTSNLLKIQLAEFYHSKGENASAIPIYEDMMNASPEFLAGTNNYIVILLESDKQEDYQKAMTLAEKLKTTSQSHFMDTYGWALVKNNRAEESLAYFSQALLTAAKTAEIHFHQGVALQQLGRWEEAKQSLNRAMKLAKDDNALQDQIKGALANQKNS